MTICGNLNTHLSRYNSTTSLPLNRRQHLPVLLLCWELHHPAVPFIQLILAVRYSITLRGERKTGPISTAKLRRGTATSGKKS